MPRRTLEAGYYHVYNRGMEKMLIFRDNQDFKRFYELVLRYQKEDMFAGLKIMSYCFLSNHFHFIVSNPGVELSLFMGKLQNAYGKYFNMKYKRKGSLFEGRFKAKKIDTDEYLAQCIAYVNYNPLKHEVVADINDYPWTSYHQITNKNELSRHKELILGELEY